MWEKPTPSIRSERNDERNGIYYISRHPDGAENHHRTLPPPKGQVSSWYWFVLRAELTARALESSSKLANLSAPALFDIRILRDSRNKYPCSQLAQISDIRWSPGYLQDQIEAHFGTVREEEVSFLDVEWIKYFCWSPKFNHCPPKRSENDGRNDNLRLLMDRMRDVSPLTANWFGMNNLVGRMGIDGFCSLPALGCIHYFPVLINRDDFSVVS